MTILIGNSDFVDVGNYTAPLTRSGLLRYAYVPPEVPMSLSAWPTLEEMILRQKRVVIFMDYNANQVDSPTAVCSVAAFAFSPVHERLFFGGSNHVYVRR